MTPMKRYEYFRIKFKLFPQDIINKYDLTNKVDQNGNMHCEVRQGMHGLPQAGIIAQNLLDEELKKAGYTQSKITPGYWTCKLHPISFTLVVDDFGIKYIGKEHAMHLIRVLKEYYKVEEDWKGKQYPGITERALAHFGHPIPETPQHQPQQHTISMYGATVQYAKRENTSQ